jgi:hypothetical protein
MAIVIIAIAIATSCDVREAHRTAQHQQRPMRAERERQTGRAEDEHARAWRVVWTPSFADTPSKTH